MIKYLHGIPRERSLKLSSFQMDILIMLSLLMFGVFILLYGFVKVSFKQMKFEMEYIEVETKKGNENYELAIKKVKNLPHKTLKKRSVAEIDMIVIHHTEKKSRVWDIADYHVNKNGWSTVGYHYMIQSSGKILQLNEIETISPHCKDYNTRSIGVCFNGNFEENMPSDAMLESGEKLVKYLKTKYGIKTIVGHGELGNTDCPGENLKLFVEQFKN